MIQKILDHTIVVENQKKSDIYNLVDKNSYPWDE